jgi:hypothetical protein
VFSDLRGLRASREMSSSSLQVAVLTAQSTSLLATVNSSSTMVVSSMYSSHSFTVARIFSFPAGDFSTVRNVSFIRFCSSVSVMLDWMILSKATKRCLIVRAGGVSHGSAN